MLLWPITVRWCSILETSTFAFEVDGRERIVVRGLHPTKYVSGFFFKRYFNLLLIFVTWTDFRSVRGSSKPDGNPPCCSTTSWECQSGKRLRNNITVGCGRERNLHDFGPGELMMKWWMMNYCSHYLWPCYILIWYYVLRCGGAEGRFCLSSGKRIERYHAIRSAAPSYRNTAYRHFSWQNQLYQLANHGDVWIDNGCDGADNTYGDNRDSRTFSKTYR